MIAHYAAAPQDVELLWPRARPFIESAVAEAGQGEYEADDVLAMAQAGHAVLFVVERGGLDRMGGAMEFVRYPQGMALNILAISGKGLADCVEWFFEDVKRFAMFSGAKWVQASTAPAMARLLGGFGFQTIYHVSRVTL